MANFRSKDVVLGKNGEKTYNFLSDFRNVESLMPEQVIHWQATENTCSFTIKSLASLSMEIVSRSPCRNIHIASVGSNPISYTMDYFFQGSGTDACSVSVVLQADLNPFLKAVASAPLQNFVEMIADKLQELFGMPKA